MLNRLLPAALAVFALAPVAALAQTDAPSAPAPAHATVQQVGTQLRWTTSFRLPPDFAAGDRVCLRLRYGTLATPRAQVCVEGSPAVLKYERLDRSGDVMSSVPVRGAVVSGTTVRATFPLAAARLSERAFSWQVAGLGVGGGETDLRAVAARTVAPPVGAPQGCVPHGAAQVTGGAGKTVALTFDDGPGPYTPQVLSILEREGLPATFFMIGQQLAGHASLLHRMLADGDAIGNHTWDHADMSGGGRFDAEIARTQAAIRDASGYTPCLVRPPYGATSSALVGELHAHDLTSVLWNVDPQDWSTPGTDAIVQRVLSQAKSGSIILMHDGGGNRSQTVAALPTIIHALKARGYGFATVPQLLHYETRSAAAKALPATAAMAG